MEKLVIGLLAFISLLLIFLFIQSKQEKIFDFFSLCYCLLIAATLIIFGVIYLALKKIIVFSFKIFFNFLYFVFSIPKKIKTIVKYIKGEEISIYGEIISIESEEINAVHIFENHIPAEVVKTLYKKLLIKTFKDNLLEILILSEKFAELKLKIGDKIEGWKCKKFPYDEELDFISTS